MEYKEKFIAFIDILGFTKFVENSEIKKGISLDEILEMTKILSLEYSQKIESCPDSNSVRDDLDFRVTQISDCVVISSEVSPKGVVNLLSHCNMIIFKLLKVGVLCRGYINKGLIYHTQNQFIGTGYIDAYKKESSGIRFKAIDNKFLAKLKWKTYYSKLTLIDYQYQFNEFCKKGTPFVEVDFSVIDYIEKLDDKCVNKIYNRLVKKEGKYTALYPFQLMIYQQGMNNTNYDIDKEKKENDKIRKYLLFLKKDIWQYVNKDDKNYEKIEKKVNFYINALEEQLSICDDTDSCMDLLSSPFPFKTIADLKSKK